MEKRKIILAVTGASGSLYAKLLLDRVQGMGAQGTGSGEKGKGLEAHGPGHVVRGAALMAQDAVRQTKGKGLGTQSQRQEEPGIGPGVPETEPGAKGKRRASGSGLGTQSQRQEEPGIGPGVPETEPGAKGAGPEVAIIFSENAREIWMYELGSEFQVPGGITLYKNNDFYAPFASGSSDWDTMIICPASMGIIGRIAGGISNDLITRAADVMLKERRKLIVVPRETPYSLIHINNMKVITEAGAIVCPATPSFYHKPATIEDLALTVVERILDLAGLRGDHNRWQTPPKKR